MNGRSRYSKSEPDRVSSAPIHVGGEPDKQKAAGPTRCPSYGGNRPLPSNRKGEM